MIYTVFKRLFLSGAFLLFLTPAFSAVLSQTGSGECDSVFLFNGKAFAVKNLHSDDNEIVFSYCDDATNQAIKAPWMQIHHVKKADGSILESSSALAHEKSRVLTKKHKLLERQVDALLVMSILSIATCLFYGIGIIFAVIVLLWSSKLKKAVIGHPKEKRLLKKIKLSNRIILAMFLLMVALALYVVGLLLYLIGQLRYIH